MLHDRLRNRPVHDDVVEEKEHGPEDPPLADFVGTLHDDAQDVGSDEGQDEGGEEEEDCEP